MTKHNFKETETGVATKEQEESGIIVFACFFLILMIILAAWGCSNAKAENIPFIAENCIRAVIGEASSEGYKGLLAVCCALRNRGHLRGVYGFKAKHVDNEPAWVWQQARKAWKESKKKDIVNGADHWCNINAFGEPYWGSDMIQVIQIENHTFYKARR